MGQLHDAIQAFVAANPGASLSAVRNGTPGRASSIGDAVREMIAGGILRNEGTEDHKRLFTGAPEPSPFRAKAADLSGRVLELARKGAGLEDIANRLDVSPRRVTDAVASLQASGVSVELAGGVVGMRRPEPRDDVVPVGVPPVTGERVRIGVVSDLHAGSKYAMGPQLRHCIAAQYASGIRTILVPGDLLDGCYRHGLYELTHHGLEDQVDALAEMLPELDGLTYYAITGNHDETFWERTGANVGRAIQTRRPDVHVIGDRGAWLRLGGALIHLWHPRGSGAYAASYVLQKQIERYSPGLKPDILLTGHYHRSCYFHERGVHAFLCPTFQGGGSRFGASLGGAPTVGGLSLSWSLTTHGTLRDFGVEVHRYYEHEAPREVPAIQAAPTPRGPLLVRCSP